ncbi:hypothetical protein J6590_012565 [Homalodisca vitripennis]|nr:hypothetical protein J6590_012565 [Homalodisca vitripennis]
MVTPDTITGNVRRDFSPVSFNGVCMCTGIRVNKINGMIDGEVPESLVTETVVGLPTVANNCRTWQNPFFNYVKECVAVTLFNRNKEGISALPFDPQKPTVPEFDPLEFDILLTGTISRDVFLSLTSARRHVTRILGGGKCRDKTRKYNKATHQLNGRRDSAITLSTRPLDFDLCLRMGRGTDWGLSPGDWLSYSIHEILHERLGILFQWAEMGNGL